MNETEFHQLVDIQMQNIEEAIDESEADIDYEAGRATWWRWSLRTAAKSSLTAKNQWKKSG